MQNHQKPPRPPPLSVSSTNPSSQPKPKPEPKPKPKPNSYESPESPLRYDDQDHDKDNSKHSGAVVAVEQYYSPSASPLPVVPTTPDNFSPPPHQIIQFNRREEPPATTGVVFEDVGGDGGERKGKVERGERRGGITFGGVKDIVRKSNKEDIIEKLNLGIRVYEIVFCLISFSVMAADRTQGWSGDSFDRYKEYRFCLSVNILGFIYAAFQAYNVGSHLATGKHVISHHLRYQFDFIMDQILAYLLISASSASASRIDDWQANWGKDEFTEKASASVSMAFLAFLGFAMSSLITGYNLCIRDLP